MKVREKLPRKLQEMLRPCRGFTLFEMLLSMSLLAGLVAIGVPPIIHLMRRSELEGTVKRASMLFYRARIESIKRGVPVVLYPDLDNRRLVAFADVNMADGTSGSDLLYNPIDGAADGATDFVVSEIALDGRTHFWGPDDEAPNGADVLSGFSVIPIDPPGLGAIFDPDGSLRARGTLRLADSGKNFLEISVAPEATPKVTLRKYNADLAAGPDGTHFYPPDWDGQPWRWE